MCGGVGADCVPVNEAMQPWVHECSWKRVQCVPMCQGCRAVLVALAAPLRPPPTGLAPPLVPRRARRQRHSPRHCGLTAGRRQVAEIADSLGAVDGCGQRRKVRKASNTGTLKYDVRECKGWPVRTQAAGPVLSMPTDQPALDLKHVCNPVLAIPPYGACRTAPRL